MTNYIDIAEMQARLKIAEHKLVSFAEIEESISQHAEGCTKCWGRSIALLNDGRNSDCPECELEINLIKDFQNILNGPDETDTYNEGAPT